MQSDEVLTWAEVHCSHRVRHGVYQRNGRLISLLTDFGRINPCYPDRFANDSETVMLYTGQGRRGDQGLSPANLALLAAIESSHAVPLFSKLSPGRWQPLGHWRVTAATHSYSETEKRMLWIFTLEKMSDARCQMSAKELLTDI